MLLDSWLIVSSAVEIITSTCTSRLQPRHTCLAKLLFESLAFLSGTVLRRTRPDQIRFRPFAELEAD